MKKGLFSILAGALLVVGCQNYDDQFTKLETNIAALASQVAGLSQVQSDLTSLAGTVNALQANIGDTVDAALADGLADIDTAVESLEAATATAASSEDVTAIATLLGEQQEDLDAILQASQFFTGNIIVTNAATLATYHNARAGFKIINGRVSITATTDMDIVKVQELVDAIQQCTGDFDYTAGSGVETEIYFNKLTSTASLTLKQKGGYELKTLSNATNISLDYDPSTDIVHLGALTTVTSLLSTGDAVGSFHFKKADELHLTSLPRYTAGTLSLKVEPGAVIDISALTDLSALNVKLALDLTLDGPTSVTVPLLSGDKTGSQLTLINVDTVNLTNYDGAVVIGDEVLSFTSNGLVDLTVTGTDLVSFDANGILDPNATTADKVGPTIGLTAQDVTSVKITGTVFSATIASNTSLATIDLGGDNDALVVQNGISITGNTDLETVDLTGTTASGVTFNLNENVASLTVDTTFTAGLSSAGVTAVAGINGTISIVDNQDLASLEISSTKLETLTVTGNDDLTSISASGALAAVATAAIGATGKPTVNIYDNDLTASKFTDTVDTVTTPAAAVANGGASDIGAITTTSGLNTFAKYLTKVKADADSTAGIYFDTVDSFSPETGTEITTGLDWTQAAATAGTLPDGIKVLVLTANTNDLGDAATFAKRSFLMEAVAASPLTITANAQVISTGAGSANQQVIINNLLTTANLANAAAAGVTISTAKYASPQAFLSINKNSPTSENSLTGAVKATFAFAVSNTFTMSIDGQAVTITGSQATNSTVIFATKLVKAWNTAYGLTAATRRWRLATALSAATEPGGALTNGTRGIKITAIARDEGSREINAPMSMSMTNSGNQTDTNIGYVIGNQEFFTKSVSDNKARGNKLLVTLTALTAGSLLGEIGAPLSTQGAGAGTVSLTRRAVEVTSTFNPNITASNGTTTLALYPTESRLDAAIPAEANAAATSNAVSFSRITWFS